MRVSQDLRVGTTAEEVTTYLATLQPERLSKHNGKRKNLEYLDITCTLDIETTAPDTNDGFLYTIQFNIAGQNFLLRYVEDFIAICMYLYESQALSKYCRCVFYIHNLGFEHMFLTQILEKHFGIEKILLTKKRKPLLIVFKNGIEFRDSLKLFQKSLAGATKGLPHEKMVGDLDYNKCRTPDTPLSPDEWNYCINDVQGLYEAIEKLKKEHGYNQATIPYTNTGMVIEEINRYISEDPVYRRAAYKLKLNKSQLTLAYKCMGGGDTHGCRWRAGRVFRNCNSYDFKSAHPSQQLLEKFPSGEPFDLPANVTEKELCRLLDNGYGWLGECFIGKYQVKPDNPDPTINLSKTVENEKLLQIDNGRVMGADASILYMDSNDYLRFCEGYNYKMFMGIHIIVFKLDYLPESFRGGIKEKFAVKESADDGAERNFAKICVNTIFGACAQKVIRDEHTIEDYDSLEATTLKWEEHIEQLSDETVYKKQLSKFPFLWGLWTASLSRLKLWELIKTVGWENAIYWDTDSVKYEGAVIEKVEQLNDRIRQKCIDRNAVVKNKKGKEVFIGVAENEHPTVEYGYKEFTFLHAKCYAAYAWSDKKKDYVLESTIAGVGKNEGVKALQGDISNLKDGLVVNPAGGLSLTYVDRPVFIRQFKRPTECASFVYMEPRVYEVKESINKFEQDIFDCEILAN